MDEVQRNPDSSTNYRPINLGIMGQVPRLIWSATAKSLMDSLLYRLACSENVYYLYQSRRELQTLEGWELVTAATTALIVALNVCIVTYEINPNLFSLEELHNIVRCLLEAYGYKLPPKP